MATITGEKFEALISTTQQDRLDNDKVRALLSEEQLKSCMKTISFQVVKTNRHSGDKPPFQMPNLSNATPQGVIDMLGETREQIKDLQKLEGLYKEVLDRLLETGEE